MPVVYGQFCREPPLRGKGGPSIGVRSVFPYAVPNRGGGVCKAAHACAYLQGGGARADHRAICRGPWVLSGR